MSRRLRSEALSRPVRFRLSPAELALAREAAKLNRQSLGQFNRDALLSAASDCMEGCKFGRRRLVIIQDSDR